MPTVCCIKCKKEFSNKGIFTHYDRSHLNNKKYSSGYNGKYNVLSERAKNLRDEKIKLYERNPNKCLGCDNVMPYEKRTNKFCSHKCSAAFYSTGQIRSTETKNKISLSLKKYCKIYHNICKNCNSLFILPKKRMFCGVDCRNKHKREKLSKKAQYRRACQFSFALNEYPDKFDFKLIEKHGWYSAPNRGNNLSGVSRDHMISIDYGWKNNIPPDIISHPANCKLLQHTENWDKREGCSITIAELHERIKNW